MDKDDFHIIWSKTEANSELISGPGESRSQGEFFPLPFSILRGWNVPVSCANGPPRHGIRAVKLCNLILHSLFSRGIRSFPSLGTPSSSTVSLWPLRCLALTFYLPPGSTELIQSHLPIRNRMTGIPRHLLLETNTLMVC